MLSGNDNLPAGGRFVPAVSSGVFAHLSSVRRLSIFHGKLFRELFSQGFFGTIYGLKAMLDFCGFLSYNVISKFMNIADDDKSWRHQAVGAVSTLTTCLLGLVVIIECVVVVAQALFWIAAAVIGLFIAHNIVHTAILGVANIGRELASSWNNVLYAPDVQFREDASDFERGFESVLNRISILGSAAIRLVPSVLVAAVSVALNPLYMLLNTVLPKLDLEEARATKRSVLEMAQKLPATTDADITVVAEQIQKDPAILWVSPYSCRIVLEDAIRSVVRAVDTLSFKMSRSITDTEHDLKAEVLDQNLSEDPEVMAALASISGLKDNLGSFKGMGSALLSKLKQADQTQPASAERIASIKILKLIESSTSPLDTYLSRESFISSASSELFDIQKQEQLLKEQKQEREYERKASALDEVQTMITEVSSKLLRSSARIACGG